MTRTITIDVNYPQDIPAAIQSVVNDVLTEISLANYGDILRDQVPYLENLHASYFGTRTGPDGRSWPSLAESTVKRKGHSSILLDTHRLIASLVGHSPEAIRRVNELDNSIEFGTGVPYSIYHQQDCGGVGATTTRPHRSRMRRMGKGSGKAGMTAMPRSRSSRLGSLFRRVVMGLSGMFSSSRISTPTGSTTSTTRAVPYRGRAPKMKRAGGGKRTTGGRLPPRPHVGLNSQTVGVLAGRVVDGLVLRLGK